MREQKLKGGGGAEGGTRTPTSYLTRPSNVRVYQFRHFGISKISRTCYFFGDAVALTEGLLVVVALGEALSVAAGAVVALGCAVAAGDATGDGDATGAGSSAPAKTDFAPVITGNPSVNANNMYATAAPIVILARIV